MFCNCFVVVVIVVVVAVAVVVVVVEVDVCMCFFFKFCTVFVIFNDDVNFSDSHYLCVHVSADACVQVSELVSRHRTRLLSKNTGTLAATEAFTTLLHAFRSATTEDILSVLQDSRNKKIT